MTGPPPWNSVHLIADLATGHRLDDLDFIADLLRSASGAAGATLIDMKMHHFGSGCGVTGVAILAESHISIHTWPEHDFAAIDIFMCGTRCDPDSALALIIDRLSAAVTTSQRIIRGSEQPALAAE